MLKKILITGATGFIGSYTCHLLAKNNNYKVFGIYNKNNKLRNHLLKKTNLIRCNINSKKFEKILYKLKPEVFIHLSWVGVISKFKNSSIQNKNFEIIKKIIKKKNLFFIKHFIFFGSQIEYKRSKKIINEKSNINPSTNYGLEKIRCLNFIKKKKVNFTWLRVFDVYGNLDCKDWLIPKMILSLRKKKKFLVKNPFMIWDFLDVKQLVGIIKIIVKNRILGVFNLCSGFRYKINDIVKILDKENKFIKININHKPAYHLKCDNSKLINAINFKIKNHLKKNLIHLKKNGKFL